MIGQFKIDQSESNQSVYCFLTCFLKTAMKSSKDRPKIGIGLKEKAGTTPIPPPPSKIPRSTLASPSPITFQEERRQA